MSRGQRGIKVSRFGARYCGAQDTSYVSHAEVRYPHHLAREDVVRESTYTARMFSAEEALAYGFATRLVADP
jgi:enoyl-CoA hydratase/carnithine racemase